DRPRGATPDRASPLLGAGRHGAYVRRDRKGARDLPDPRVGGSRGAGRGSDLAVERPRRAAHPGAPELGHDQPLLGDGEDGTGERPAVRHRPDGQGLRLGEPLRGRQLAVPDLPAGQHPFRGGGCRRKDRRRPLVIVLWVGSGAGGAGSDPQNRQASFASQARISASCSPRPGAGRRWVGGVDESAIGDATVRSPAASTTGPRPRSAASRNAWPTVLIGPAGTPARFNSWTQWATGCRRNVSVRISSRA